MSEAKGWQFTPEQSAEKRFVLDSDDIELNAIVLIENPVRFLQKIRKHFLSSFENEAMVDVDDPLDNPVVEAQLLLEELGSYILNNKLAVADENLSKYLSEEISFATAGQGFYEMLRQAGYTKEEIKSWIDYDDESLESVERFDIRKKLAMLDRVYADES